MGAEVGRAINFTWGGSAILGLREKGIAMNGEPIDVTSDEDSGKRKLLTASAQDEVNVSLSGVTKDRRLMTDWFAGNRTKAGVLTYSDGSQISGDFFLASYTDTGPYNDAVTFEAELQSTGTITFTPGS